MAFYWEEKIGKNERVLNPDPPPFLPLGGRERGREKGEGARTKLAGNRHKELQ
jgi:hypothetical protein